MNKFVKGDKQQVDKMIPGKKYIYIKERKREGGNFYFIEFYTFMMNKNL
jgi:hypothetical protein